mmetsp:Transcript_895/g.1454  ORF Transcript_895/g.1454 Transcript_895/m.1454 type:complete len:315 (-) Transcript_895:669-1613(-)
MSPQFRAITQNTTSTLANGDGEPCNSCSVALSVAELAKAADMSFALHKIESDSSAEWTPLNPLLSQDSSCTQAYSRKRSCNQISSQDPNQPFLSSYGSAFLSGIFADIAQASDEKPGASNPKSDEPHNKKIRTMPSALTLGRPSKSFKALAGLTDGADNVAPSVETPLVPFVVSPRSNQSTANIHHFKDQVRELQGMAFPSLPQIPNTISSSSFSSSNLTAPSLSRDVSQASISSDMDQDSSDSDFGWFVSTDDDADSALIKERAMSVSTAPAFDDLAFKARPAVGAVAEPPQDTEVQQALAADTIDDVLGDFF